MTWKIFNIRKAISLLSLSKTKISIMPFYAVAKGRTAGIYMTWPDCEAQVKGFPGAKYKKFENVVAAQDFITANGAAVLQNKPKSSRASSSSSSLKRSFSTTSHNNKDDHVQKKKTKNSRKSTDHKNSEWPDSDDSEDLNSILTKQMDDIEKRLNGFQKGVDKIIHKSVKNKKTILLEQNINSNEEFQTDQDGFVQVYTDGACSSNGRQGARAGLGVYWGEGHPLNISAPVSGRATNNCGEIQAATQAIKTAINHGVTKLSINTDSKFLINSVTKWMSGWKRKGWKLQSGEPVKNEIDFKELDSLQNKLQIKWNYVEAHHGIHGNEMADQLAKAGAAMYVMQH